LVQRIPVRKNHIKLIPAEDIAKHCLGNERGRPTDSNTNTSKITNIRTISETGIAPSVSNLSFQDQQRRFVV
jgi:hypothetical protein